MTGSPGWRVTASRHVLRDRWISLRADTCVAPDGTVLDPYYVLEWPDWAQAVALTPDDELVLVRQWRPGPRAWVLEPPGGVVDPGETPAAAAARELLEETGYAAAALRPVIAPYSDPSRNTNRIHTVLATGAVPAAVARREAGETMETVLLPVSEALAAMRDGRMNHALHLGGVLLALEAAGRIRF